MSNEPIPTYHAALDPFFRKTPDGYGITLTTANGSPVTMLMTPEQYRKLMTSGYKVVLIDLADWTAQGLVR